MMEISVADGTRCRVRNSVIDDRSLSLNRSLFSHFERKLSDTRLFVNHFILRVDNLVLLNCLSANGTGGAGAPFGHPVFEALFMEKVLVRAAKLLDLVVILKLTEANDTFVNLEGRPNDVVFYHHFSNGRQ
jgi:hypothetical protein